MKKKKKQTMYMALDLNGRVQGYVLGIFNDLETARLYAANTAAHITLFEVEAVEVE